MFKLLHVPGGTGVPPVRFETDARGARVCDAQQRSIDAGARSFANRTENSRCCGLQTRAPFKFPAACVLILLALLFGEFKAAAFTSADANTMITSYNNAFYFTTSGNRGYFRNTTDGGTTWFWGRANEMEMILDVFERTNDPKYLTQFQQLYNGFVSDYGTDWRWNEFNDDIMWAVIACSRAYLLTGNSAYRSTAKFNFDACYARAWSSDLGGGLFWKSPLNTSKNACVNGPAAIASYLLYQSYNDASYLTKADQIFQWERATLVEASTGRVYDNINISGAIDKVPITYNSGTYIGAANYLGYTNDAVKAANYVKNIMNPTGILPQYEEDGDLGGFNGIFLRWMGKFMRDRHLESTYELWLQQNANAAWNCRRLSDNLCWSKWRQTTPPGTRYSFGCWGSVEALHVVAPSQTLGADSVGLAASDAPGASSFESGLNWSNHIAPSSLNNFVVSGLQLRTPADGLHHTFAGSSLTISNGGWLQLSGAGSDRLLSLGTELILDNGAVANYGGQGTDLTGLITLKNGGGTFDPRNLTMTVSARIMGSGTFRVEATSTTVSGKLMLSGDNHYTGGTLINSGDTLALSGIQTLGVSSGSLMFSNTINRGFGTLDLNGNDLNIGNLTGTGGRILNNNADNQVALTIGNGNTGGGFYQGAINDRIFGSGTLRVVKVGSGTIAFCGVNTYTGGTTVSGGTLQFGDGLAKNGNLVGHITNNAQIVFANPFPQTFSGLITGSGRMTKSGEGTLFLTGTNTLNGGLLISEGMIQFGDRVAKTAFVSGNITNNAELTFANPGSQTFSGSIRGNGTLTKIGTGTLTFTTVNPYTGPTLLGSGTLALSGSAAINSSSSITVSNDATLSVLARGDHTLTLSAGQALNGDGTVAGNLIAGGGTILRPGNSIGTLNVQGSVFLSGLVLLELDRANAQTSDRLAASGTISAGGVLMIVNSGLPIQAGDTFQLFNQPVNGFSAVNLPELAAGLYWTNRLAADGTIQALASVSLEPASVIAQLSGGEMMLSWPQDHTGWRLQMQTGSLTEGLGTNWIDVANSTETNQMFVPVDSAEGSVFYRLIYP